MSETPNPEKRLSKKATDRVNKLREKLSGAVPDSRGARTLQRNRAANPLFGAALHAAARLEAGHELSDLERTLVDALGKGISEQEIKAWGKAYRETKGARTREILPDVVAEWPIDEPFTMKDLADALPAQVEQVKAQPNVRVVDIAKLAPGQELDQRDEAFLAAANEYGSSFVYFTSSAPPTTPAPASTSAEAGSGEVLNTSEVFIIQPFKMQTIKRSGDTAFGPSDEIFWATSAATESDTWTFRSREFGSCDDGDWDDRFDPSNFAFIGPVHDSLALTMECWEKDHGSIFNGISGHLRQAADHCMRACQELQGDPETDAAGWAALLYVTLNLVAALLELFNNEDDHVANVQVGFDRAALLSLDNTEQRFRFDGETARGMGIQDLYLRFCTIPTGKPMRIVAQHSNRDITVGAGSTANNADVHQWVWSHVPHQTFHLDYKGGGYFSLRAVHSGKVLDVPGSSHANETAIIQYNAAGTNNQLFRLDPLGGYWYRIAAKHSGKVLNVKGKSTQDGGVITQYDWANVPQQKWKIWPAE